MQIYSPIAQDSLVVSGSMNVSGSVTAQSFTGSFSGTASYAATALTASYALTASVALNVPATASYAIVALTASYANFAVNTTSASFAVSAALASQASNASSASFATNAGTAGSASFATNASNAASASYALSASYATASAFANNATSASYALSASFALSTSNAVSASFATNAANASSASYALNSSNTVSASFARSASYAMSASYATASSFATTASYALFAATATTSSFATNASTAASASFATNAGSAGSASYAVSASYATASGFAASASYALNASNAVTASHALNSVSASYALFAANTTSASYALSASYAFNSSVAVSASFSTNAGFAGSASFATQAANASSASFATNAANATSASYAQQANTASSADNFTVRGTLTATNIVVQTITSSQSTITGSTRFGSIITNTHQFTGSVLVTGSINVIDGVTNNLTSSWALRAISSSFASNASTAASASFATSAANATTASHAINAVTASFALNSQNAFVQGGNSFGAQALLGTNDTQNLALETNGTVRMVINGSDGNVGIGTTTPAFPLTIYNATTSAAVFQTAGTGTGANNGFYVGHTGNISYVWNYNNFPLVLAVNNAEVMRITGSSVGIGTTSPLARLDVRGGSDGDGMINIGGSGVSGIINSPANIYINADSGNASSAGIIGFGFNRTGFTGGTEVMRILEGGSVSIGTTNAVSRLTVSTKIANASSPYASGDSYIALTNPTHTDTGSLVIADNGNTWLNAAGNKTLWLNWWAANAASSRSDLRVGDGFGGLDILSVVGSTRRIGINSTFPAYNLDVRGNAYISASSAGNPLYVYGGNSGWVIFNRSGKELYLNANYGDANQSAQISPAATSNMGLSLSSREIEEDLYITGSTGYIGINTKTPTAPLTLVTAGNTVDGTYFSTFTIRSTASAGSTAGIRFDSGSTPLFRLGTYSTTKHFQIARFSGGSADDFAFYMQTDGNVGIGTSTPNVKLQVAGIINSYAPTTDGAVYISRAASSGGATNVIINSNGASYFNGGNVGIGTTNPTAGLEVVTAGNLTNAIRATTSQAFNASPSTAVVFRYRFNTSGDYTNGSIVEGLKENATDGNQSGSLAFWTNNGSAVTEQMRITSRGSVGIGTTSPLFKLDIAGDNETNSFRVYGSGASFGPGIRIHYTGTGGRAWNIISNASGNAGGTGSLQFWNSTDSLTAMVIQSAGNVGIGTSTPTSLLSLSKSSLVDFQFNASDQATDEKNWIWQAGGAVGTGVYRLRAVNDAYTNGVNAIIFTRSGISSITTAFTGGGVGIGTTTPTGRLNVIVAGNGFTPTTTGPIGGSANTRVHVQGGEPGIMLSSDINPTTGTQTGTQAYQLGLQIGFYAVNDIRNQIYYGNAPLTFVYSGNQGTSVSEYMRINTSGNVGIGTTAPGFTLDVLGAVSLRTTSNSNVVSATYGTIQIYRQSNTIGNGVGIAFGMWNSSNANAETAYLGTIITTNTAGAELGDLAFYTTNNGGVRNERMRITSGGSVGIGTSGAGTRLTVLTDASRLPATAAFAATNVAQLTLVGSDGGLEMFSQDDNTTWGHYLTMKRFNGSTGALIAGFGFSTFTNTGSPGSNTFDRMGIHYGTNVYPQDNTELFTVKSGGNIGINTSNPAYRLDVYTSANNTDAQIRIKNATANASADAIMNIDGFGSSLLKLWRNGVEEWKLERISNTDDLQLSAYGGAVGGGAGVGVVQFWDYDTGNIGIGGVTSPEAELHIQYGPASISQSVYLDTTNGNGGAITFGLGTSVGPHIVGNTKPDGTARGAYGGSRMFFNSTGFSFDYSSTTTGTRSWSTYMTINSNGNVGVGTTSGTTKFHVNNNGSTNTTFFVDAGNCPNTQVLFEHSGDNTPVPFAIRKSGYVGSSDSFGVLYIDMAHNVTNGGSNLHFTLRNSANATQEYSGLGGYIIDNSSTSADGGIRFWVTENNTTRVKSMDLINTGTLRVRGDVVAYYSFSDERLKNNISPIEGALEKVMKLQGVTYEWKDGVRAGKKDIGLIAQQVQQVVPEVVKEQGRIDGNEYLSVNYEHLVGLLVESIKELKAEIDELKNNKK
jgi:hypothetical protein